MFTRSVLYKGRHINRRIFSCLHGSSSVNDDSSSFGISASVIGLSLGGAKLILIRIYPLGSQGGGGGLNRAPVIAPQWLELLSMSLDTRPNIQDKH